MYKLIFKKCVEFGLGASVLKYALKINYFTRLKSVTNAIITSCLEFVHFVLK